MSPKSNRNYQVLVLAAGKGTRMRSRIPKVLHRVCGITLLERTLRAVQAIAPERIVVVVGAGRDLVCQEIEVIRKSQRFSNVTIEVVEQSEQRGTGDAVRTALPTLSSTPGSRVLILPGDSPLLSHETLREILAADTGSANADLLVVSCNVEAPDGFGRIVRHPDGAFRAIVEHKDCSPEELEIREINASIYGTTVTFLTEALSQIEPRNAQGEYYLTDIAAYGSGKQRRVFVCKLPHAVELLGANSRAELAALEGVARARINQRIMESGASLEDPTATYIDEDVIVGEDCFLGAGVRLRGRTTLATGVWLEGDTVVKDSFIGSDSEIRFGSHLESAKVGAGCKIGPYARLRPGTVLGDDVHIGNFVELKQSEFGKGSKANHLSYIGDSTVGTQVNIGAGTITCNYDGVKKHRTVIEDGAFIGSDTALVAPVTIGAGAVTGAGSVITRDVPAGALAVERSEQVHREGYRAKKK